MSILYDSQERMDCKVEQESALGSKNIKKREARTQVLINQVPQMIHYLGQMKQRLKHTPNQTEDEPAHLQDVPSP